MEFQLNGQNPKSAIVLVVDRLNTAMLPPFGNTMIDTPKLNRLAGQSVLFDFAISDSPDLLTGVGSIWNRSHAASAPPSHSCLPTRLANNGIQTILLTDDGELSANPISSGFDRIIKIESPPTNQLSDEPNDSWLASFFAQTLDFVQQLEPGSMLWVHCRALSGPWDAPYEYRSQLADEEDPDPPDYVAPPRGNFDQASDSPDILLGHQQSCAAQIMLLDEFLGVLLDQVATNKSLLFSMLSTRGFPLGEHGQIGEPLNLHGESVHVPYMIRWPDKRHVFRSQNLIQPSSLHDVLCNWFEVEQNDKLPFLEHVLPDRDLEVVVSTYGQMQSIQTHAWKLIRSKKKGAPIINLFKKPDDRWEVNDVYDRCPRIAPKLELLLDDCLERLRKGETLAVSIDHELAFDG